MRHIPSDTPFDSRRPRQLIIGRLIAAPPAERMKGIARWIALGLALLVATVLSSSWLNFARYFHRPQASGVVDPIFGQSITFCLFTLPALGVVSMWFLLVSIVIVIAAVIVYGFGMTIRFRGISLAGSLLTAIAFRMFLARRILIGGSRASRVQNCRLEASKVGNLRDRLQIVPATLADETRHSKQGDR